ncbi:unnamed protein product [Prunus armeniaca]|uniref:Uncharacterized protein n=1 Tax=Prunus armeniaca TaxID=36596 RepID=A0A6J5X4S1_PRUAR|nr:unnamed protein product [Prunus armeniaca]
MQVVIAPPEAPTSRAPQQTTSTSPPPSQSTVLSQATTSRAPQPIQSSQTNPRADSKKGHGRKRKATLNE